MPTPGERLAKNRERLDEIKDVLEGGGDVTYERSVRGRLHHIENTVSGFVVRRRLGTELRGWQAVLLAVCAVGTVVAAWYSALYR